MGIVHSQRQTFLRLLREIQPWIAQDPGLPGRIESLLKRERAFGSRDRRLYRELLFTAVRFLPWLPEANDEELVGRVAALAGVSPATGAFRDAFARPELLVGLPKEALLPAWFREECPAAFEAPLLDILQTRPPLWLRTRAGRLDAVRAEFDRLGWQSTASTELPTALRLRGEADVTRSEAFQSGWFEVQDLGSQLLLALVQPVAGGTWFDACAGAGGKTLQLADLLGPAGRVFADDVRPAALQELSLRATRAGLRVEGQGSRTAPPGIGTSTEAAALSLGVPSDGSCDGVLVDAPCSGTGTWRRAPHLKWSSSPEWVARCARRQTEILEARSRKVRLGGLLVYATCSLCRTENQEVVAAFLARYPEFAAEALSLPPSCPPAEGLGFTVNPARFDSDGYFVSALRRR